MGKTQHINQAGKDIANGKGSRTCKTKKLFQELL